MTDILDDLSVKALPVIESNRGEYVDEDWVFEVFKESHAEIVRLRSKIESLNAEIDYLCLDLKRSSEDYRELYNTLQCVRSELY